MATTFKVLGNGTPILSMRKWAKIDDYRWERKPIIDEDDLACEWEEVKDKYPNISKEEFELKQKEFQEV